VIKTKKKYKIAVLGSGNGGLTFAGDFALAGHTVNLCELPQFGESIKPIIDSGSITMAGVARTGSAKLNMVTTNVKEAIDGVEAIIIAVPAYGHIPFAQAVAPHLEDGQMITLNPGYTLGAVEFAKTLGEKGVDLKKTMLGAVGILVYSTRKYLGSRVFCEAVKAKIPFAALPAKNTTKMLSELNEFYPQDDGERGILVDSVNELKLSLENINVFQHPPMMILKAVDVELGEEPYLKSEKSYAVALLRRAMNREVMAITKAFGMEPWAFEYTHDMLMYPYWVKRPRAGIDEPEWAKPENQPSEYAAGRGFNFLKGRYITEDLPYGLVPITELGDVAGVETPTIDAVVDIGSAISETNYRRTGRTLEKLGLADMSKAQLLSYVNEGRT
jgi:opine dehydrogenase